MKYAVESNIGRRPHNEDLFHIPLKSDVHPFVAVSDGMGGHAAGAVASEHVIRLLSQSLLHINDDEPIAALKNAIQRVNLSVFRAAEADSSLAGMGATLVCALLYENRFIAANIGDSRLYHYSDHALRQVTTDHSLVQMMVNAGNITKEEARTHPKRNIITRAMGIAMRTDIDLFDRSWMPGDILLLCSDGLSGSLPDATIEAQLEDVADLQVTARKLVQSALDAGATDNVTVILAQCEGGRSA